MACSIARGMARAPLTAIDGLPTISSIGHGTAAVADFIAALGEAGVNTVADVRSFPGSRRNPQFGSIALAASLASSGIAYVHLRGLGGRRKPLPDSPNTGLRIAAFRAYADHMTTDAFASDYAALIALAHQRTVAFMCAETLWWRCHRRLLADRFTADGWSVVHLRVGGAPQPHQLTDAARVEQGRLEYGS
jgi:uncharacterized protein (DUF488 family)